MADAPPLWSSIWNWIWNWVGLVAGWMAGLCQATGQFLLNYLNLLGLVLIVVVAAVAIVIGPDLLIYARERLFEYLVDETEGVIVVDTPEVHTRERLVNDRVRQVRWLRDQLKVTERDEADEKDSAQERFRAISLRELISEEKQLVLQIGEAEPKTQTNSQNKEPDGISERDPVQGPSDLRTAIASLPESVLTSRDEFIAKKIYRDLIRAEIMKTNLDDRHDIDGNTLYRLNFDTTIAPGHGNRSLALIKMKLYHKIDEDYHDYYDLALSWKVSLERSLMTSLEDLSKSLLSGKASRNDLVDVYKHILKTLSKDSVVKWLAGQSLNDTMDETESKSIVKSWIREFTNYFVAAHTQSLQENTKWRICELWKATEFSDETEKPPADLIGCPERPMEKPNLDTQGETRNAENDRPSSNSEQQNTQEQSNVDKESVGENGNPVKDPQEANTQIQQRKIEKGQSEEVKKRIEVPVDHVLRQLRNVCARVQQDRNLLGGDFQPTVSVDRMLRVSPPEPENSASPENQEHSANVTPDDDKSLFSINCPPEKRDLDVAFAAIFQVIKMRDAVQRLVGGVELKPIFGSVENEPTPPESKKEPNEKQKGHSELEAKLAELESELEAELEARLAELEAELASLSGRPRAELEARLAALIFPKRLRSANFQDAARACGLLFSSYHKQAHFKYSNVISLYCDLSGQPEPHYVEAISASYLREKFSSERKLGPFFSMNIDGCELRGCTIILGMESRQWPFQTSEHEGYTSELEGYNCPESAPASTFESFCKFINELGDQRSEVFVYSTSPRASGRFIGVHTAASEGLRLGGFWEDVLGSFRGSARRDVNQWGHREEATVVGYGMDHRKEGSNGRNTNSDRAEFGWIILPRQESRSTFGLKSRQPFDHYDLSALISVPSWWKSATLEVKSCWLPHEQFEAKGGSRDKEIDDPSGLCRPSESKPTYYSIRLPGTARDISHKLDIDVLEEPYLASDGSHVLEIGRKGRLILTGGRLWRSTRVTLDSQIAEQIEVLPDMSGIIATFDCVERPPGRVESYDINGPTSNTRNRDKTAKVRVWTSEGRTNYAVVTLKPFSGDGTQETPCYASNLKDDKMDADTGASSRQPGEQQPDPTGNEQSNQGTSG